MTAVGLRLPSRASQWLALRGRAWRYCLAPATILVATVLREQLLPGAGDKSPFQTYVLAVLATALLSGFGPGLLATALGAAAAIYLYLPPFNDPAIEASSDMTRLGLFGFEGLLASIAGGAIRRAATRELLLTGGAERFRRFLREAATSGAFAFDDEVLLVEELSEREVEIVRLLALGLRNGQIAERLFVSRNTVKTHLAHVYGKLGVATRTEAVSRCLELGLLSPPDSDG